MIFEYSKCDIIISHDSFLTLGMTGSFGGFMPGGMGGGSPFGSMQVGLHNNDVRNLLLYMHIYMKCMSHRSTVRNSLFAIYN